MAAARTSARNPGLDRRAEARPPARPARAGCPCPAWGKPLTAAQKEANRLVSRERAANEHGFADLENWRILSKVRMNARHATMLLRVVLVLTNAEVQR
ncbi:transposase family protein [Kitasatospora sp. NPDC006697]|uniref:transposase family protein n=1 Tax=Kitasatospora sp. NPDC006697 TaxID=3364020 RepID=UPI0036AF9A18